MVTKRLIRIPPERNAAAAAGDSKREIHKLQKANNNNKPDLIEASKDIQRRQVTDGGKNHDIDDEGKSEAVAKRQMNDNASKKRSRPLEDTGDNCKKRPLKGGQQFINLSDVPEQLPILSNRKGASSKYEGVTFNKASKKWQAQIWIDGKSQTIGYYDNEEEAAKDYAGAVFKYLGGKSAVERQRQKRPKVIDLSDVSDQLPILSNRKGASSKYEGVTFNKACKKWQAQIRIDSKQHSIGYYDDEEEAAKDYARAVFKYRGGESALERQRQQQQKRQKLVIDLGDVPEQLPILKSNGKSGSSKYQGVSFDKRNKKWQAQIAVDGNSHHIGLYDNEEEAAKDYARAVFKHRGVKAAVERQQTKEKLMIDLSDVPEQLPILERNGKSGASKYQGVTFNKARKKWRSKIRIDRKQRTIGYHDNEEAAAKYYACAVFKYRGGEVCGRTSATEKSEADN